MTQFWRTLWKQEKKPSRKAQGIRGSHGEEDRMALDRVSEDDLPKACIFCFRLGKERRFLLFVFF